MRSRNFLLASFTAVFIAGMPAFEQPFIGHAVTFGVAGGTSMTDALRTEPLTGSTPALISFRSEGLYCRSDAGSSFADGVVG